MRALFAFWMSLFAGLAGSVPPSSAGSYSSPAASGLDIRVFGAKCDGSTDDAGAMNGAIVAASSSGQPTSVIVPEGLNCAIASPVTLVSNVTLVVRGEVTWIGGPAGPMFQTSAAEPTNRGGVIGEGAAAGRINPGAVLAGDVFRINGGLSNRFANLEIEGGNADLTVFDFRDTLRQGPQNNAAFDTIEDITTRTALVGGSGAFGTFIRLEGAGQPPNAAFVTDNHFRNIHVSLVSHRCIDFVANADSNEFFDVFCLLGGASGGVGVVFNSGAPGRFNDIDQEFFYNLIIDTPACCGFGGRTAVVNNSFANRILGLVNSPVAENGVVSNPENYDLSYELIDGSTGLTRVFPGKNSDYGADLVVGGAHTSSQPMLAPIATTCAGVGSGRCDLYLNGSGSHGLVTLAPMGDPSAHGAFELHFPSPAPSAIACTFSAVDGTGAWSPPVTIKSAGIDLSHLMVSWYNGAPLEAGSTYLVAYDCHAY